MKSLVFAAFAAFGAACAGAQSASELLLPPPGEVERRYVPARFRLDRVIVEGVTAIPQSEIAAAVERFVGQSVGGEELREMVRLVDALYEARGHVGTRTRLDDQPIVAGAVRLRVTEQRLSRIDIEGNFWNRRKFIEWSAWPPTAGIVHLPSLQGRLAQLKDSGLFERVAADLRLAAPGSEEAGIRLDVVEALPFSVSASVANNRAPSVGSVRREIAASHRSLLGWGDTLAVRLGRTRGLDDSEIGYTAPIPLTPIAVFVRRVRSDSLAIDPPVFRSLDIVAISDTDAFGATATLLKAERLSLAAGVSRERRETITYLLGIPFSFTPGLPDGLSTFNITRGSLEGGWRGERTSISARLGYSRGRIGEVVEVGDGLGLSQRFGYVQAGFGMIHRLETRGELRVRLEGQRATQPLPPVERLAIGGSSTVRGYRENLMLRESGVLAGIEWRLPERELSSWARLGSALFVDTGWGRDRNRRDATLPSAIASAGVAVDLTLWKHLRMAAAFGIPNRRHLTPRDDLQDRGIHLAVSLSYP
ncbi:MAG: ShlB/FhaC/HecB family hemolysin secretion/activation protein [Usitatibacter sp.]